MAEALLRSLPDGDGDGIPDALARLLNDQGFGLDSENWKNRRRLIHFVAVSAWCSCLLMVLIWSWCVLFTNRDIPPNLLNFGTTMFWAMNMLATTLVLGYAGISQMDTNSYRKNTVEMARSLPAPTVDTNNYGGGRGGGGYGGGYNANRYGGGGYGGYYGGVGEEGPESDQQSGSQSPVAPPIPLPPGNPSGGPRRKPGVIT